jgi:hypothetical protein
MKRFSNFALLCLILIVGVLSSCKKPVDPEKTELEKQKERFVKEWKAGTVNYEGSSTNIPGYENFTLTVTPNNFTTSGVPDNSSDLPNSGTWTINESNINKVLINGNELELIITKLDDAALEFNTTAPGVKSTDPKRTINYKLIKK